MQKLSAGKFQRIVNRLLLWLLDAVSCKLQHLCNQLCLSVGLYVGLSPLRLLSPDWSKFGYLHSNWSILRMRIAQVMPKIDLIVTTNLPTARQANILSVMSLWSLELENEKTEKEEESFHRISKK